jgi:hypothetical protein
MVISAAIDRADTADRRTDLARLYRANERFVIGGGTVRSVL